MNTKGYVHYKVLADDSLSIGAKSIYTLFKLFVDDKNICRICVDDITDSLLMHKTKVRECVEELSVKGIIVVKRERIGNTYKVRNEEKDDNYGIVYLSVILSTEINYQAKVVYSLLCSMAGTTGYCYPKQTFLASKLGVARQKISTYTTLLESKGIILKDKLYKDSRQNLKYFMPNFEENSTRILNQFIANSDFKKGSKGDIGKGSKGDIGKGSKGDTYNNQEINNNIRTITNKTSAEIGEGETQSANASCFRDKSLAEASSKTGASFANAQDCSYPPKAANAALGDLVSLKNFGLNSKTNFRDLENSEIKFSNKTRRAVYKRKPAKTTESIETANPSETILNLLRSEDITFDNDALMKDPRFYTITKMCGLILFSTKEIPDVKALTKKCLSAILVKMADVSIGRPSLSSWCFKLPKADYAKILELYEDSTGSMTLKRARELLRGLISTWAVCSTNSRVFDAEAWANTINAYSKLPVASTRNSVSLALELTLSGADAFVEKYVNYPKTQKSSNTETDWDNFVL